jgi:hypothetical protein
MSMSGNDAEVPVSEATGFIKWLHEGAPFETCIIGPKKPTSSLWEGKAYGAKAIVAGWFIDPALAAKLGCQVEATGVYVTLNPSQEALLSRANSRLKAGVDRTPDSNIARIRNLLIDIDPVRPTGVSSSDPEHDTALAMVEFVKADLREAGWPDPLVGDSGNGAHLIYALDLPNDPAGESKELIHRVLVALQERYKNRLAEYNLDLDQKVFNPGRLTKMYGTWARKGDNTAARPHRLSRVISLPPRKTVSRELLKKLAGPTTETPPTALPVSGTSSAATTGSVDVQAYLDSHGIEVTKIKAHGSSTLFCLAHCIFDLSHVNEAAIGQKANGALFYQCFHNSCQGRTWVEARHIISGQEPMGPYMVGGGGAWRAGSSSPPSKRGEGSNSKDNTLSFYRGDLKKLKTEVEEALKNSNLTQDAVAYVLDNIDVNKTYGTLTAEVEEWALTSVGEFLTSDVHRELGLTSRDLKKQANESIRRLAERGKLIPCGTKRGCYRAVTDLVEMDWKGADVANVYPVKWPFGLEHLVTTYPGNICVVAGEKGSGKSAFMYNLVKLNQERLKIAYFNSEAGPEELKKRLTNFEGMRMSDWKFKTFSRSANFPEVIFPDHLNIIDYFEFKDEAKFYEISGEIRKIHDKLRKGICVIALQKKKGAEFGRGGDFSREKARMYLTMGGGKLTIVDGKIWASDTNPNGMVINYKLIQGAKFIEWE